MLASPHSNQSCPYYSTNIHSYTCPALQPHQYPLQYFVFRTQKNKFTIKYYFRTILLYIATVVLLRAWLIFKSSLSPKISSSSSKTYARKTLLLLILLNYFTVVEAMPTRKKAVDIIQAISMARLYSIPNYTY